MKDTTALAYVNMYGILGALENLCELDTKAQSILAELKKPVALCFSVKGGPCCTFAFGKNGCKMQEGEKHCTCKMSFSSPEKFNALIAESKPGLPTKNPLAVLQFLTGPFTKLTNRLSEVLQPKPEQLKDPDFFKLNTLITLYTVAGAVSALANNDPISKESARYTVDGEVSLGIKGGASVTILVKDHRFTTLKQPAENPRAVMEFASLELAHGLFAGEVSTVNEMCKGTIRLSGMISMLDNINRILDRVSVYLA